MDRAYPPSAFALYTNRLPRPRQEAEGPRCICGKWPGQHRWGDNACPNPAWKCGNGRPQWLHATYKSGVN